MSFEAITSIAQAEADARSVIQDAEAQARQMVLDAENSGKAAIEDAVRQARAKREDLAKETEAKIDARREEILNSKSDYKEATGKIWYVSNKGSDENDGASDKTPVATIARAHELANAGDAILFERGGMWRGSWGSKEGIIYSAYGKGPKPIMNGNVEGNGTGAENWTLVEGTTNIYKYAKKMLDIGNIIYNDGARIIGSLDGTFDSGAAHVVVAFDLPIVE